jgi:hypothetical protein
MKWKRDISRAAPGCRYMIRIGHKQRSSNVYLDLEVATRSESSKRLHPNCAALLIHTTIMNKLRRPGQSRRQSLMQLMPASRNNLTTGP